MRCRDRQWVIENIVEWFDLHKAIRHSDPAHGKDVRDLAEVGKAIAALVDLAHQRITALCDHLGVTTEIVPPQPAKYEVRPKPFDKKSAECCGEKSDDKTVEKGE